MTDKDLTEVQLAVYAGVPHGGVPGFTWDYFETGEGDLDVVWGAKKIDGITVIALRGSVVFKDWIRDIRAFACPVSHSKLGPLHPGFASGVDRAWKEIQDKTAGPRIVIGHSLGAARASILTGLMVADGQPPLARVVWGEPKAGFDTLSQLIAAVPSRSYRNGDGFLHDIVTDVPLSFPPEEYVRCGTLIDVRATPSVNIFAKLGIFAFHHFPLYVAGTPPTPALGVTDFIPGRFIIPL